MPLGSSYHFLSLIPNEVDAGMLEVLFWFNFFLLFRVPTAAIVKLE